MTTKEKLVVLAIAVVASVVIVVVLWSAKTAVDEEIQKTTHPK